MSAKGKDLKSVGQGLLTPPRRQKQAVLWKAESDVLDVVKHTRNGKELQGWVLASFVE